MSAIEAEPLGPCVAVPTAVTQSRAMGLVGLVFGTAFGFLIAAARLTDYDVIHRMLLLQELDVFLLMGSAIGVAVPLLRILERRGWQTPYGGRLTLSPGKVRRDHVLGAMVFGTGWAVAGTCPGPIAAMVGAGNLLGLAVMAGLVSGILLREAVASAKAASSPLGVAEAEPAGTCI